MAGNSWGKGEKTPWGGYTAKKDGHDSIYSKDIDSKGYVDHENHVHFHKDGATKMVKNILLKDKVYLYKGYLLIAFYFFKTN